MPEKKRRVNVPGRGEREATLVMPTQSNEHWNTYLLEDGSVVRMKLVATEFMRIEDEYDREGNPLYYIRSTNVTAVEAADSLRKPKQ